MHELSLVEQMLELIEEQAQTQAFTRVQTIWLELGRLSCVEPSALLFCFDAASKHTLAEGAELRLNFVDGQGNCLDCDRSFQVETRFDPCPFCHSQRVTIDQGDQMRITQLAVE